MHTSLYPTFSKALLSTVIFSVLFIHTGFAQQLSIKNTSNGKVRVLKQGQKMSFKLVGEDEFTKGKISSFTDSSMVVFMPDEDDVMLRDIKLKEIYSIKKTSTMHKVAQAAGAVVMVGGAVAIFEAPSIAGDDGNDWLVRGAGVVGVALGLLPYLIKTTEYIQGTNVEFTIVK